jgi:DNA (cytosine-5)-methyltransferase 1
VSSVQGASLSLSMKFNYRWNIKDGFPANNIDYHGTTVMTTFACGGGSTMGYKLAGYDVVAANDIDPQMEKVYTANFKPKQYFLCGVKELINRNDLPQVDILDGSPPCSVFSMVGSREKAWQKDKIFREGQAKQILDDLFFDFIDLAGKMQPKIVIAENVKGMLQGHAKWYTREVVRRFEKLGYKCQVFLLNAATMGVPQKRERVFFIAHKTDKKLSLSFTEQPIKFRDIYYPDFMDRKLQPKELALWNNKRPGERNLVKANIRLYGKNGYFKSGILKNKQTPPTIIAGDALVLEKEPRHLNKIEISLIGSFPQDYKYENIRPEYLIGMSVPPVMMAQVAYEVYNQLIRD